MFKAPRLTSCINFLIANISCSLFQLFALVTLAFTRFFIWFFSGQFLWSVFGDSEIVLVLPDAISYISVAMIYGGVWLGFWKILHDGRIRWFYWRLIFALIPLFAALLMFDPEPNPMAMIPVPAEPIFSSLITAIILLPIYSILIYRFILQSTINKVRNSIFICLVTIFIGSLIFYGSWNMMHVIYG